MKTTLSYQYVKKEGAETYIFLHGFMGSKDDWKEVVNFLKGSYSLLLIDLPGHGDSKVEDNRAYTMENSAFLVMELLKSLKIDRVTVVGYSMGGRLALYLALQCRGIFKRAILESASPGLKDLSMRIKRCRKDRDLANRLERGDFREFLNWWYLQPVFASLAKKPEKLRSIKERRMNNHGKYLAKSLRFMGLGMQPSLWESLKDLSIPLRLIVGERDEKFIEIAREMLEVDERINLAVVENAGHNAHEENCSGFCQALTLEENIYEAILLD